MAATPFTASMQADEAVLRFPYDDRLRRLLRALPGRRWDAVGRVWCVPLEPEQAQALSFLFEQLGPDTEIEPQLAHRLRRLAGRRDRRRLLVDLARPDERWWLSFATDIGGEAVSALLEHPEALVLAELERALVPVDREAAAILREPRPAGGEAQLTPAARRALEELDGGGARGPGVRAAASGAELRRDRSGGLWVLIGAEQAARAAALADAAGLRHRSAPGGGCAVAAAEHDAPELAEVLAGLAPLAIAEGLTRWLERALAWSGNVEVLGAAPEPCFLLCGEHDRLPAPVRERAARTTGGSQLPLTLGSWELIEQHLETWLSPAAKRCVQALREGRPPPPAVLELGGSEQEPLFLLAPGHDERLPEMFGRLAGGLAPLPGRPGRGGREQLGALRVDPFCVDELDAFLASSGTWVTPAALERLQEIREQHAEGAGLVALSSATDAELAVPGLGGELKPFQRAGVSYLLERRRAFLADEQGLGKTIQALAAIEAARAYPAVIVCPASLKLNWMREIERWLPGRAVRALAGTAPSEATAAADISLVNYEILGARLSELSEPEPRAVILDEAHYCKNPSAKRTQAVARLTSAVASEGLVLALSGTPVVNRPAELVAQLRLLGRLQDFGSGADFGARFRGSDAHLRLHWHLRARCFVRRLKRDVLPQLPAKTRAVVPVGLDNEAEYRLAERDLIAWLRTQPLDLSELDSRVAGALRAERLVRLNALKLLAARGKLASALSWIHDFASSGERLVVFARHREVQHAVLDRFPGALHILGSDSPQARDRALRAFQEPDDESNQLIVCSMEVAGQGLTLTRASNVAFLELGWTPAGHDQAEDRCHRIGQVDAVTAYYLLAAGTVDETISTLLERKRAVIGAVTDGRAEDESGIADGLVRELLAQSQPYRHLRAVA